MSHLAYEPDGPAVELEVDHVVVGSGAGGAMAGVVLARGGRSVAIVEAGAWRRPEDYPSSCLGAMRDVFDDWGSAITMGRAFWPVVQARTVGGTTVINSAICVRTPDDVFDEWRDDHGLGDPAFRAAVQRWQDVVERELCVEEVPEPARGHSNRLAMIGANRVGYDSHVMRRYVRGCEGAGQCLQGCRGQKKQSTNLNYVPEVLERGGHVLSCAPVRKVRFEGRRAIGVEGRFEHPVTHKKGARFFVRARRSVLVAASATHSPLVLRRSGLRHAALGEYFRAHPGTGVFGRYADPVDMNIGATQGWASTAFRKDPGLKLETLAIPPEMVASRLAGGGAGLMARLGDMRHLAMWVHAVRAEAVGSVRANFLGKPAVRYQFGPADMHRLRAGIHLVAKTHVAAGAEAIAPGIAGLPYMLAPNEIDQILEAPLDPRRYIAVLSHLFGGCVMGTDPSRSVADPSGAVRGYEGLYVADASALPTTLGVNPQHTIMGVAGWIAEQQIDGAVRAADERVAVAVA